MMERVDEMVTAPVVGKYYWVPTVRDVVMSRAWPVIGPKHQDAEHLNFPFDHYHFDWRFMPASYTIFQKHADPRRIFGEVLNYFKRDLPEPTYRPRKCLRLMPLNTLFPTQPNGIALHRAWAGKDAHRGAHGLICPHRGTALGSITPEPDGSITCPLHGLKFCAATGRSIPTCQP